MRYFSGFCLKNESELFKSFTCKSDFCVIGFSYGAQQAFEYTLACKERVDTLQLISPAFFMDKSEKYKRLQIISFRKNSDLYCKNFLENVTCKDISKYFVKGSLEELKKLLFYEWDREKFKEIKKCGIEIEVYLGEDDKIINSLHVKSLFKEFATIYYIKKVGHTL
ncbi:MAG: pimelyl-ACP methyl ester esterase BioV [Sulfurospirillum sp.]|nr:pimelyl-ACP methyl ester esterase BioV [Sulfurospirillum sp.]MBL0703761.1 pimelyl-ACP methyl ester esterase BioV [Sulfurospirillum sp.]